MSTSFRQIGDVILVIPCYDYQFITHYRHWLIGYDNSNVITSWLFSRECLPLLIEEVRRASKFSPLGPLLYPEGMKMELLVGDGSGDFLCMVECYDYDWDDIADLAEKMLGQD